MDRRYITFVRIFFMFGVVLLYGCGRLDSSGSNKSELKQMGFTLPDGGSLDPKFWSHGKSVIYFGFSHCPDMCPLALTNFGRTHLILGPRAKEYRFIFITLDPNRDAPSLLKNYMSQFPGGKLIALSPNQETLSRLPGLFGIVRKQIGTGIEYNLDHSNFIYVLDEKLNQIAVYPGGTSANSLANSLRALNPDG